MDMEIRCIEVEWNQSVVTDPCTFNLSQLS